jgi:hypothetical protein
MSCDRVVRWYPDPELIPTKEDIEAALTGYIGEGGKVHWETDRFFVDLPGAPSDPFPLYKSPHETRWFEVWIAKDQLDVITRQADEFTMVVAEGFASLCVRRWQGLRDPD